MAPSIAVATSISIVFFLTYHVHIASVIGTTAAATIAACATFARMHMRAQRYVRFAIRARLSTKAAPEYDRLTRSFRSIGTGNYIQQSAHPSPEINDALREAEMRMGMREGSVLALVVPLELILGVPHNCPAAAAMLYASRHPVILIDDHIQRLLDDTDNYTGNYDLVVSVMCHELAHLIGWNTRWSRLTSISEFFVTTAAMASLVAYGLENNFIYGIIGAIIAATYLACEPVLTTQDSSTSIQAILARISLVAWVPYVIAGLSINALPVRLTFGVTALSFGLRIVLSALRRKQELYADIIAVHVMGSADALSRFLRTLHTHNSSLWIRLFSTHPSINTRIKTLRKAI